MGLDITHNKATLSRPEKLDPFHTDFIIANEFEGFDVDVEYFAGYIQKIDTPQVAMTLILPKNEEDFDEVKAFLNGENYHFLLEKDAHDIDRTIDQFIAKNHLLNCLVHRWETLKWTGVDFFTLEQQLGFYYEDIGYQRKGMNRNFWNRFCSGPTDRFTRKEDFDYALECVDFYREEDTEEKVSARRQLFRQLFVDQYEPNRSWMDLCY